ncbi:hypothetical protein [Clostridium pasteurianum]|uniref:hypothetical protein n=1 Tax=Clostridium pasteurianum TaxID=1501 RepID=UPI0018C8B96A|nr:hypothetical protein [Clostridium pasteurianum]
MELLKVDISLVALKVVLKVVHLQKATTVVLHPRVLNLEILVVLLPVALVKIHLLIKAVIIQGVIPVVMAGLIKTAIIQTPPQLNVLLYQYLYQYLLVEDHIMVEVMVMLQ